MIITNKADIWSENTIFESILSHFQSIHKLFLVKNTFSAHIAENVPRLVWFPDSLLICPEVLEVPSISGWVGSVTRPLQTCEDFG